MILGDMEPMNHPPSQDYIDDEMSEELSGLQKVDEVFRPMLHNLTVEAAMVFHGIALLLCRKLLTGQRFDKYHKTVVNLVNTYKQDSNPKLKEDAIARAEEDLM